MIVELMVGATLLLTLVGAVLLSLLGERIWARLVLASASTTARRHRRAQGSISVPIPWTQLALRGLAFASYTSMGVYLPAAEWENDKATRVVEGSQVLMAAVEGDTLVVDCLVPGELMPTGGRRLWVPFTLRARLPHAAASDPISASLSRWIETGAPVDLWIGQQGGVPFVRLAGASSHLTLALRSSAKQLSQHAGRRQGSGDPVDGGSGKQRFVYLPRFRE